MQTPARYYLLYLPLVLAYVLANDPVTSYLVAWFGSLFIFYLSFTGKIKPTGVGVPLAEKILKPIYLTQLIFAGYMSASSIFYFIDQMGYEYLTQVPTKRVSVYQLDLTASCQRLYLLGHIAFVHAMFLFYKEQDARYEPRVTNWPMFFLKVVLVAAPLGLLFSKIGGLSVLAGSIEGLALVASTISFALAIPLRKTQLMIVSGLIFGAEMAQALTSGFKEPVIVSVMMLGLFLFPFYKRTITVVFIPLMFVLFSVLPTYVNTFRGQKANSGANSAAAKEEAMKKVREDMAAGGMAQTNWAFLTDRISEIGMFTKYVENRQQGTHPYGFQIIQQSFINLVPRIFWKDKPIMEYVVMARVIENGIVSEDVNVSAKPQYVVDGYLSAGAVGVWFALFVYGLIAQVVCNRCEKYFGGYFFGVSFVFTGMFQFMWRGNCFEFIYNNIFYGMLGLVALFYIFRRLGILVPVAAPQPVVVHEMKLAAS